MRVVFMGTPKFAADILTELKEQHEVVGVYTRADAVRGRGSELAPSPVKAVALEAGIPVFEPRSLRDADAAANLAALAPDVVCVAAYGKILPQAILDAPRLGCLNVHASLLPKYRGAAPIERAILAGEAHTGVCIMRMEAGLDTGPYCICRSCEIGDMGSEALTDELAFTGARALLSALYDVECGQARWTRQDDAEATYAPKIEKGELNIDPGQPAAANARRIQASSGMHPSRATLAGKGATILRAASVADHDPLADKARACAPGKMAFVAKRLFLGCADGAIEVLEVKPDGKKAMDAASFASGVQGIKSGDIAWERN